VAPSSLPSKRRRHRTAPLFAVAIGCGLLIWMGVEIWVVGYRPRCVARELASDVGQHDVGTDGRDIRGHE